MQFVRQDDSGVVSYDLVHDVFKLKITATKYGARVVGAIPLLRSQSEVDELFQMIQWAFRHHESLVASGKPIPQTTLDNELQA